MTATRRRTRGPGPRTINAVFYVAHNPGSSKHEVSRAVGPNGSNRYGNEIVLRALRRGLVEDRSGVGAHAYSLYVTSAGRAALAS